MKTCPHCGNNVNEGAAKCQICGGSLLKKNGKIENMLSSVKVPENTGKPKSKIIFILLTFVGFGLGWFYLGYQDKFIHRSSLLIKAVLWSITLICFPVGIFYMLYWGVLLTVDILRCFFVKYDAFGNELKWIR